MRDRPRIGEILVFAGVIEEMQLISALGAQSRWGKRLGVTPKTAQTAPVVVAPIAKLPDGLLDDVARSVEER